MSQTASGYPLRLLNPLLITQSTQVGYSFWYMICPKTVNKLIPLISTQGQWFPNYALQGPVAAQKLSKSVQYEIETPSLVMAICILKYLETKRVKFLCLFYTKYIN